MTDVHDTDSFYPYRVQQEQGAAEVPVIESPEDIHKTPPEPVKKKFPLLWVVFIILFLLAAFILLYNAQARRKQAQQVSLAPSPEPSVTPSTTPSPSPTQKVSQFSDPLLQEAYNKTIAVNSMRVGFISDVVTKVHQQEANTDQQLTARVEGYFFGLTNGDTIQTELHITQTNYPNALPAFFGQILVDNRLFIKRNDDKWEERDRSDFNKLYENQPIDATAYAYNMVDTLFTPSRALLRAIDQNTIKVEADEKIDDKTVKVFSFQFSNNDYLTALQNDATTKDFTLADAHKILANAIIAGKVYINPDTRMINRLQINGTNFTQIAETEANQEHLGIVMTHDIALIANLLDFDKPIQLQAPE